VILRPFIVAPILALLDGRLEEAVEAAARLVARGEELGAGVRARAFAGYETLRPLLQLGRAEEALAAVEAVRTLDPGAERALALVHLGRLAEAREILTDFMGRLRTGPEEDEDDAPPLTLFLEVATLVEDREDCAVLSARLAGISRLLLPSAIGWVLTCVGRHLAAAAVVLDDRAAARRYCADALEVATRASGRRSPWSASSSPSC
jgi:hypothetical protein